MVLKFKQVIFWRYLKLLTEKLPIFKVAPLYRKV